MNKLCCFIILIITSGVCNSQNLVPNGDFEQYYGCPTATNELDSSMFWINPATGTFGISGTPDYFNQCNSGVVGVPDNSWGNQFAHGGGAYSGILLWRVNTANVREYIEVPLTSPLIANTCYSFEMFISSPDQFQYSSGEIQVYFSDTAITGINNYLPLPFLPQIHNSTGNVPDTINWTLVSGDYTAVGGELFLVIGNFKNDSNTIVTMLDPALQYGYAYAYIDDVCLHLCENSCTTGIEEKSESAGINIYPNPVIDILNISINNNELSEIILYDITSRKLLDQKFINSAFLNTEQLAKGIYLYEVRIKNGMIKKGKVVKD